MLKGLQMILINMDYSDFVTGMPLLSRSDIQTLESNCQISVPKESAYVYMLKKKKKMAGRGFRYLGLKHMLNIKQKDCSCSCIGTKGGKRLQETCLPPASYTNSCRASHDVCEQLNAATHAEQPTLHGRRTGQPCHCPVNGLGVGSMRDLQHRFKKQQSS